jgi:lipopolysaccharide assembly protein A
MMRYVRYACIAVFALALIAVALANRGFVTLKLLPVEIAGLFAVAPTVDLPLFVVIFGGIIAGLLVGFVWEWLREHKIRAENARNAREVRRLEREVARLKSGKHEGQDEVLALLDKAS